ncbi:MAG: hypothetical protein ACJ736_15800 [Streptomyces sp.]
MGDLADPDCAVRITLRRLARRCQRLEEEIAEANADPFIGDIGIRRARGNEDKSDYTGLHGCSP